MHRKKHLKVYVAYGWQKFSDKNDPRVGNDSKDVFWKSIRSFYAPTADGVEKRSGVRIELSRLSAGIDGDILNSIIKRIKAADVLLFDLGASTKPIQYPKRKDDAKKVLTRINENVLFELGVAMGLGKRLMILCPKWLSGNVPSDIIGRFLCLYKGNLNQEEFNRTFIEGNKVRQTFRSLLIEALPPSARRRLKAAESSTKEIPG